MEVWSAKPQLRVLLDSFAAIKDTRPLKGMMSEYELSLMRQRRAAYAIACDPS
jgi:hypothetical protein